MTSLRFYTLEQIGPRRAMTPEGYLLCMGVPIARTGILYYQAGEVPIAPDARGNITIRRDASEVFTPSAILSFAGKPVTDSHPPEAVGPTNFRGYSLGVVLDPHQGVPEAGENDQLLYADLLIQDGALIEQVMKGRREVSAGYDAYYEQLVPGKGVQRQILGNHVAIVDANARGRCGPVCAIGDQAPNKRGVMTMPKRNVRRAAPTVSWRDRIMQRFATGDETGLVDELDKVGEMLGDTDPHDDPNSPTGSTGDEDMGGTHVHIHTAAPVTRDEPAAGAGAPPPKSTEASPPPGAATGAAPPPGGGAAGAPVTLESLAARMDRIEQAIAILAAGDDDTGQGDDPSNGGDGGGNTDPPPTDDQRRGMVGDSTSLRAAFAEMLSRAEILNPGMRHPTFDARQGAKITVDGMCAFRRRAVEDVLAKESDGKDAVLAILAGRPTSDLRTMTCDSVQMVFNGASEALRSIGVRASGGNPAGGHRDNGQSVMTAAETVAAINQRNRERVAKGWH